MKKIFVLFLILIPLLSAGNVIALAGKVYTVEIGGAVSGNTTEANGGASVFIVGGSGTSKYDLYPYYNRFYSYTFQLTGLTVSQVQQEAGGDYGGSTFSVYAKFRSDSSVPWADVQPIYIFYNERLDSSITPFVRNFKGLLTDEMRLYFETSGATPFDGATGELNGIQVPVAEYSYSPFHISSTYSKFTTSGITCVYEINITGVSTSGTQGYDADLIPPDGANWVAISPSGDTTYWTFDEGSTVPSASDDLGKKIANGGELVIPVEQYRKGSFDPGGVASGGVAFDWYIDKP